MGENGPGMHVLLSYQPKLVHLQGSCEFPDIFESSLPGLLVYHMVTKYIRHMTAAIQSQAHEKLFLGEILQYR